MNVKIDGVSYYVERWGQGFPLVVLHGFTGNAESWRAFQKYWQAHSQVIAIDLIGHGKTDCPDDVSKYTMEAMADALERIFDELDIEKADVLGYSMGGRLALTFALTYDTRVRTLILESASPGLATEAERRKRREQDRKLADFIVENGIEAFVDYWENIPLFASQKRLSADVRLRIRKQRLANSVRGLCNSLLGMGTGSQPSWWDELHRIEACLVTGALDEKFCHIAREMQKRLRSAKWVCVEDAGHAVHVEKPQIFAKIVSEFLKDVRA